MIAMVYILAFLISACLISGQAAWGSAVKQIAPIGSEISTTELASRLLVSPKIWLGGLFYILGTAIYFLLLSKAKFFSVQIAMTGLAIIFSTLIAHFFFKETISPTNFAGILLVLSGVLLVFK